MSPLEALVLGVGGNAVLLAVLGLLARSLMSQLLAKDLKRFETELSHRTTLATEELKHRLGLAAQEHHVRFTKLHERQANVIEEIYTRILDFEDASAALTLANNDTPENLMEFALRRAEDAGRELSQYIRRHEIFLSVSTSIQLHALLEKVETLLSGCSFNLVGKKLRNSGKDDLFPETKDAWTAVHRYLEEEAPLVRKALEMEFRKHLGAASE